MDTSCDMLYKANTTKQFTSVMYFKKGRKEVKRNDETL